MSTWTVAHGCLIFSTLLKDTIIYESQVIHTGSETLILYATFNVALSSLV